MTKILFRPLPKENAEIPPAPSYSSVVQIRINPIPWVESYDFSMIIENAVLPLYDHVKIMAYRQGSQQGAILAEFIYETLLFGSVYEIYAQIPYFSDYSYRFVCYKQNVEVLNVPAIITYDSDIPWTPPTPEELGNVILFEGLTAGSKVSLDYNYWNEKIKEMEPLDDQSDLVYILLDMEMENGGNMTVEVNQREEDNLIGYLSSNANSLSLISFRAMSMDDVQYDIEDYQLELE